MQDFSDLNQKEQEIIKKYLSEIEQPLDTGQLYIYTLEFEGNDDDEKYKVVKKIIDEFLGGLGLKIPGLGKRLHDVWRCDILDNGSKDNINITLSKKDLIWPIIVIGTKIDSENIEQSDELDSAQYEEVKKHYKKIIDSHCERYEFFTKVLSDYNEYKENNKELKRKSLEQQFIEDKWNEYSDQLKIENMDSDILEELTKIIMRSILKRRIAIDKIKKGVGL